MAQERGAIGLVTLITPTYEKLQPWDKFAQARRPAGLHLGRPGRHALLVGAAAAVRRNARAKGGRSLVRGCADAARHHHRAIGASPAPRSRASRSSRGIAAERHSDCQADQSPNVVGVLRGSDPALANEYIVLSAHLDAIGLVEPVKGDAIVNGAMDNASGIATMLEVGAGLRRQRQTAQAARSSSSAWRRRKTACSAPPIWPSIRWSAAARWSGWSISTCRS